MALAMGTAVLVEGCGDDVKESSRSNAGTENGATGGTPSPAGGTSGAPVSGSGATGFSGTSAAGEPGAGGGGEGPTGGGAPADGAAGAPSSSGCPADAVFCADFETTELPTDAVYNSDSASTNWLDDFEIDHRVSRIGGGSLRVKPNTEAQSGSAYQMLAAKSGGNAFWVRFYWRSDQVLGQDARNVFVSASAGVGPNDKPSLEFVEDCGIAFNNSDTVVRPDGSSEIIPCMTPLQLEPDTWYCVELSFDGASGDTELYIDGEQKIDAKGWSAGKGAFKYVKFGVNNLHPVTRTIWYDEFVVAPARIGCPFPP